MAFNSTPFGSVPPDQEPGDLSPTQKAYRMAQVRRLESVNRVIAQLTGSPTLGELVHEHSFVEFLSNTIVPTNDLKESALTLEMYMELYSRFLIIPEGLKAHDLTAIQGVSIGTIVEFIQNLPRFLASNGLTSYCLYNRSTDPIHYFGEDGKLVHVPQRMHLYYNEEQKQLRVIIGYINLSGIPGNPPRGLLTMADNGSLYSVDIPDWSTQHKALT